MDFAIRIYPKGMKPRTIGVIEEGVFKAKRSYGKHFFIKFNAWGLDYNALNNQIRGKAFIILIIDITNNDYYYTTPEAFMKYGKKDEQIRHYQEKDENGKKKDHLTQIFLSKDRWTIKERLLSHQEMFKMSEEINI